MGGRAYRSRSSDEPRRTLGLRADIRDPLGLPLADTDRLRHVCLARSRHPPLRMGLGRTRPVEVHCTLDAPSGAVWTFGCSRPLPPGSAGRQECSVARARRLAAADSGLEVRDRRRASCRCSSTTPLPTRSRGSVARGVVAGMERRREDGGVATAVFISYRRTDSIHLAGRFVIGSANARRYECVPRPDIDPPRHRFREVAELRRVDAVIVLIGPRFDPGRLHQPHMCEWSSFEALDRGKPLLPLWSTALGC